MPVKTRVPKPSVCVGCGCDDNHACKDMFEEPCSWLIVDKTKHRGVCSCCPAFFKDFEEGSRRLSQRAIDVIMKRSTEGFPAAAARTSR